MQVDATRGLILALSRRQSFETNFQVCHRSFLLKLGSITGMTELNCFKQILLPERLCQEFDCAPPSSPAPTLECHHVR